MYGSIVLSLASLHLYRMTRRKYKLKLDVNVIDAKELASIRKPEDYSINTMMEVEPRD